MASNRQLLGTLNSLARINRASAQGFNVAANNVKNRGLKVILKTYAQGRANQAEDLEAALVEQGGRPTKPLLSLSRSGGALHRGWINIKSAMTVGQEKTERVVLDESLRGEEVMLRRYSKAMQQEWPAEIQEMLAAQEKEVQRITKRVAHLAGREQSQLVVRLFDSAEDADRGAAVLREAGLPESAIEQVNLDNVGAQYRGSDDHLKGESAAAGALIGGAVLTVAALLAVGGTILFTGQMLNSMVGVSFWALFLGSVLFGLFIGGLFGLLIGVGIAQDDEHRYAVSLVRGSVMLLVDTPAGQVTEVSSIMKEINARRFAVAG